MTRFNNTAKLVSGAAFSIFGMTLGIILPVAPKDVLGMMIMFYLLGIAVGPNILYEFANPWLKIYLVSGPLGVAFIKLSIKIFEADKKVTKAETDKLKKYMSKEFSDEIGTASEFYAKQYCRNKESIFEICNRLKQLSYAERIGIITQLFTMAVTDGNFCDEEESALRKIAHFLHIGKKRYFIIKSNILNKNADYQAFQENKKKKDYYFIQQFFIPTYNPYLILGLENSASIDEIKKTYRDLVKKYHPDVVLNKSELVKKQANDKFLEINEAYEKIKKIRGIK